MSPVHNLDLLHAMNDTVVDLFLKLAGIVISAYVGAHVRKRWEQRDLLPISADRRRALLGTWEGSFDQEGGPDGAPLTGRVEIELNQQSGKALTGTARFEATIEDKPLPSAIAIQGGYRNDRFLTLAYTNRDSATVHFGSIILELSADGKRLAGRFLGYGFMSQRLVHGTLKLVNRGAHH